MTNRPEDSGAEQTHSVAKDTGPTVCSYRRSILAHAADLANAVTLAGLFSSVLGIFFAARGVFSAAVIALLWATFCDWFDGPIARRTKGRTDDLRALGGQLDSLVDIVSSGVGPAILLLSIGEFSRVQIFKYNGLNNLQCKQLTQPSWQCVGR